MTFSLNTKLLFIFFFAIGLDNFAQATDGSLAGVCDNSSYVMDLGNSTVCIDPKLCTTDTQMFVLDGYICVEACPAGYKTAKDTDDDKVMLCVPSASSSSASQSGNKTVASFDNGDELVKPCDRMIDGDKSEDPQCFFGICPLGSLFDGKSLCYAETSGYAISEFEMTGSGTCEVGNKVGTLPQCAANADDFNVKFSKPVFLDSEGYSKRWSGELLLKFTVYQGTSVYNGTALPSLYLMKFVFLAQTLSGRTLDFSSFITSVSFADRFIKIKQEASMFTGLGRGYRVVAIFVKLDAELSTEAATSLLNAIKPQYSSKDPRNEFRFSVSEMNTVENNLTKSASGVYEEGQIPCQVEGCEKCSSTNSYFCEACDPRAFFTVKGSCVAFETSYEDVKSTIEKNCTVVGCEACSEQDIMKCVTCKSGLTLNSKGLCESSGNGIVVDNSTGTSFCQAPNCKDCDPFNSNICRNCASGFSKSSTGDCLAGNFTSGYDCKKDSHCTDCRSSNTSTCYACNTSSAILKNGMCVPSDTTGSVVTTCTTDIGCIDCNSTTGTCAECATDYIKYGNKCILESVAKGETNCTNGVAGCSICKTSGGCSICQEGFVLNGAVCEVNLQNSTIATCLKSFPGCKSCSSDLKSCQACMDGYELSRGQCAPKTVPNTGDGSGTSNSTGNTTGDITCKIENCKSCSTNSTGAQKCDSCLPSFELSSAGVCLEFCRDCAVCTTDNCDSCDKALGIETCTFCSEGYKLDLEGQCVPCSASGCSHCFDYVDTEMCDRCLTGYNALYYQSADKSACVACNDQNCDLCSADQFQTCMNCKSGMAIDHYSRDQLCTQSPSSDEKCNRYVANKDSTYTCQSCKQPYVLNTTTFKCDVCLFSHCSICTSIACSLCDVGYSISSEGDCIESTRDDSTFNNFKRILQGKPEDFGKSTTEVDYTTEEYTKKLEDLGMKTTASVEKEVTEESYPFADVEYTFSGSSFWFREKLVIIAEPSFYPEEVEALKDYIEIDLGMDLSSSYDYSITCNETGQVLSSGVYKRILNITIPSDLDIESECDLVVTVSDDYNKIVYSLYGLKVNPPSQDAIDDIKLSILNGSMSTDDMGSFTGQMNSVVNNILGGSGKIDDFSKQMREINSKNLGCEDYCDLTHGSCDEDDKCVCSEGYAPPTCKNTTAEMETLKNLTLAYGSTIIAKLDDSTDDELATAGSYIASAFTLTPDPELAEQSSKVISALVGRFNTSGSASVNSSDLLTMAENHAAGSVSASVPEETLAMAQIFEGMGPQMILESGCQSTESTTESTMVKVYVLELFEDLLDSYEFTLNEQTFKVQFSEAFKTSLETYMAENPESIALYFVLAPLGSIYPADKDMIPSGGSLTMKILTCSGDNIADDIFYDDTVEVYIDMPLDPDYQDDYLVVSSETNDTAANSTSPSGRFLQDTTSLGNETAAINTTTKLSPKVCKVNTDNGSCEMQESQSKPVDGYITMTIKSNSVYLTVSEEVTEESADGVTQYTTSTTTTNGAFIPTVLQVLSLLALLVLFGAQ